MSEDEGPVRIQLECDSGDDTGASSGQNTNIKVSVPTISCGPVKLAVEEVKENSPVGNGNRSIPRGLGPPTKQSSLLGADLLLKPASLAMPPPTLTTVKKARNLVNPGMSMVKWMKLQETRVRAPTRKKIPLSEIAKHNSETDCWMVIRNCVYDVTEYIPYHPGGVPELMKGAGKDATALFNEVHRWVNFDSILKSCLLGYLQIDVGESFEEADEDEVKSPNSSDKRLIPLPVTKFSQNETDLIFQVDTRYSDDDLSDDNWCVSVLNRERLLLKVILKPPDLWMTHVKLLENLRDDSLSINFQNSFRRAVITIKKPSIGKWNQLGSPLENNNKLMDSRNSGTDDFSRGTIVERESLTHNVLLIGVQVTSSSFIGVPVGFHLKLRLVDGNAPTRKYTPVIKSIVDENCDTTSSSSTAPNNEIVPQKSDASTQGKIIYFIIKIYPDGQLTKEIGALEVNSQQELGGVSGRYDPSFFSSCNTLALVAAGSGITPFVRIADFLKKRSATYPISRIILFFFNHAEQDIIWRDQWTKFADSWPAFHFFPVLSSPGPTWTGLSGRVDNVLLFESILLQTLSNESGTSVEKNANCQSQFGKFKVMLCGSSGFNDACVTTLRNQSIVQIDTGEGADVFIF